MHKLQDAAQQTDEMLLAVWHFCEAAAGGIVEAAAAAVIDAVVVVIGVVAEIEHLLDFGSFEDLEIVGSMDNYRKYLALMMPEDNETSVAHFETEKNAAAAMVVAVSVPD